MPTEDTTTLRSGLDVTKLLAELEVPFSPDLVRWRVTNTTNDKRRGQIVPYADSRAYTARLNVLFTPQGWSREYKVETMTNITRVKKGESIVSGKVLVTCTVTILGIGSHSGTGEEWADDDNGMTSADAQAARHRTKHPAVAGAAGRQIIVRQGIEPWLTMGTWAPVGSRNGAVFISE